MIPETLNFLQGIVDHGGTQPTLQRKQIINTMVKGLVQQGIFDKLSCLYIAGHDQTSSLVNVIDPQMKAEKINANNMSYVNDLGWQGAIGQALDLQINLATDDKYTDGQGTMGFFATDDVSINRRQYFMGSRISTIDGFNIMGHNNSGNSYIAMYGEGSIANYVIVENTYNKGLYIMSMKNNIIKLSKNGNYINYINNDNFNTYNLGNFNIYGLAHSISGSISYENIDGKIGAFIIGAALTHGQNSQTSKLYDILNTYFKAIGVNPIWQS